MCADGTFQNRGYLRPYLDRIYRVRVRVRVRISGLYGTGTMFAQSSDTFTSSYISTIGVDFNIRTICMADKLIKLQIWDTCGYERFRTATSSYYRGAHAIMIFYDCTNMETFENVRGWLHDIDQYASENVSKHLIGTKSDLTSLKEVSLDSALEFAIKHISDVTEISSKNSENVEKSFMKVASVLLSRSHERTAYFKGVKKPGGEFFYSDEEGEAAMKALTDILMVPFRWFSTFSFDNSNLNSLSARVYKLVVEQPIVISATENSISFRWALNTSDIMNNSGSPGPQHAKPLYQVQMGDPSGILSSIVDLDWLSWQDLGTCWEPEFNLTNLTIKRVAVRVRATFIASDFDERRIKYWSKWSTPVVLECVAANGSSPTEHMEDGRQIDSPDPINSKRRSQQGLLSADEEAPSQPSSGHLHPDWKQFWHADGQHSECEDACGRAFSISCRKHHCRSCGKVLCSRCCPSSLKAYVSAYGRMVRICRKCHLHRRLVGWEKSARRLPSEPNFAVKGLERLRAYGRGLEVDSTAEQKFMAEGATSLVYRGTFNGIPVSIKQYKQAFVFLREHEEMRDKLLGNRIQTEEEIYKQTRDNPYSLSLMTASTGPNEPYPFLVTELVQLNDRPCTLLMVLTDHDIPLNWRWKIAVLYQVAIFLQHIHSKNIIHVDLKAENCLVTSVALADIDPSIKTYVKVFDFNSAVLSGEKTMDQLDKLGRTLSHTPPEILRVMEDIHGAPAISSSSPVVNINGQYDVYSFGILMAEVASRRLSYDHGDSSSSVSSAGPAASPSAGPSTGSSIEQETTANQCANSTHSDMYASTGVDIGANSSRGGNQPAGGLTDVGKSGKLKEAMMAGWRPRLVEDLLPGEKLPEGFEELAKRCWHDDAAARPSAEELVVQLRNIYEALADIDTPSHASPSRRPSSSSLLVSAGDVVEMPDAGNSDDAGNSNKVSLHASSAAAPTYIVILDNSAFKRPLIAGKMRLSINERLERDVPGLKCFARDSEELSQFVLSKHRSGVRDLENGTIFKKHPGHEHRYILVTEFADEMHREKRKEFGEIMAALGAREIRYSSVSEIQNSRQTGASLKASLIKFPVPATKFSVTSAFEHAERLGLTLLETHEKPQQVRPVFDEERLYLFYHDELEWQRCKSSRMSQQQLETWEASVSISNSNMVSWSTVAEIAKTAGISVAHSTAQQMSYAVKYQVKFFSRDEYCHANRLAMWRWSTVEVIAWLEAMNLKKHVTVFAQHGITGRDLGSSGLESRLKGNRGSGGVSVPVPAPAAADRGTNPPVTLTTAADASLGGIIADTTGGSREDASMNFSDADTRVLLEAVQSQLMGETGFER